MMPSTKIDDTLHADASSHGSGRSYYGSSKDAGLLVTGEKSERDLRKGSSIEAGIFDDGGMPNETNSDFEFGDVEDLFDDEHNNLVGKHIELFSLADKAWNVAYVLRCVRGIHHILYFHGLSEW